MKTIKTILVVFLLAIIANTGFAQTKNILIYKNVGPDITTPASEIDSIKFANYSTPGTVTFDSYTDTLVALEAHGKTTWLCDKYKALHFPIGGGFEVHGVDLKFDEANPANIKFDGMVDLSTTSTFEPGRDEITHCVNTSLGVTWTGVDSILCSGDTITWNTYTDDATKYAYLSAGLGDVVAYGNGYKATADMTFKGVTAPVTVYLKYLGETTYSSTVQMHNFSAWFEFNAGAASTDPWYCGSSIKNRVVVTSYFGFKML